MHKVDPPDAAQTDVKKYSRFRRNSSAKRISRSSKHFYSASSIRKNRRESRSIFPFAWCTRTVFLLPGVRCTRMSLYACTLWESARVRAPPAIHGDDSTSVHVHREPLSQDTFAFTAYEPYRRSLRLFRFNDRHPDSDGDSVVIPEPSREHGLAPAFDGVTPHPSPFFDITFPSDTRVAHRET